MTRSESKAGPPGWGSASAGQHSRRGTILDLSVSLFLGSTSGAKDTAMIFLVSQVLRPVRVIFVSWEGGKASLFLSHLFN